MYDNIKEEKDVVDEQELLMSVRYNKFKDKIWKKNNYSLEDVLKLMDTSYKMGINKCISLVEKKYSKNIYKYFINELTYHMNKLLK